MKQFEYEWGSSEYKIFAKNLIILKKEIIEAKTVRLEKGAFLETEIKNLTLLKKILVGRTNRRLCISI
jgi:hypothetical protein